MKRRTVELFNISFLDILSGALGAVLFLFIVVPKGDGEAPGVKPQLAVTYDTVQKKFFGELPDSMLYTLPGDSLLAVMVDFGRMPSTVNCPEPRPCPKCPDVKEISRYASNLERELNKLKVSNSKKEKPSKSSRIRTPKKEKSTTESKQIIASKYKGDLPSVPCKFSVEVKWDDIDDNVDLFLCKDGRCVYGGRRKNSQIGFWDSGKSKTSIFGGDLRSTQEAIRQFDSIIEGEYDVFVQYKDAKEAPKSELKIQGLVYSNTIENGQIGKTFIKTIPFNKDERTHLGKVSLNEDGTFNFSQT